MSLKQIFSKGIWSENPVLVLALGICPTLAVTNNAVNGFGMGIATTAVLLGSNTVISLMKNIVPRKIRIPVYIVVIASFVTIVEMLMKAYAPAALYQSLGIFISLIVVNCIVLGRAEAFASKNGPLKAAFDGLGMGLGFTMALSIIGGIREFLTSGSLFDVKIITAWQADFMLPSVAAGGFIVFGVVMAGMNYLNMRKAVKSGKVYVPPKGMDCRHCQICDISKDKS